MPRSATVSGRFRPSKQPRTRAFRAVLAWFLVALQLALSLHFALVPHRLGAELGGFGFVHVDGHGLTETSKPSALPRGARAFVQGSASAASDPCSLGFAGLSTVLFARPALTCLLAREAHPSLAEPSAISFARCRLLLSAPKTSPPRA